MTELQISLVQPITVTMYKEHNIPLPGLLLAVLLAIMGICGSAVAAAVEPSPVGQDAAAVCQVGEPGDSPAAMCDWLGDMDETGYALAQYYFNRSTVVKVFADGASIPFRFPTRPTVSARVGGVDYQMLFDTGTYSCILRLPAGAVVPAGLELSGSTAQLARLESKNLVSGGVKLDYAIAPYLKLGGLRIRDAAFRIYTAIGQDGAGVVQPQPDPDFQGAISPVIFREWVIGVNNEAQLITLDTAAGFMPPPDCLVVPILMLPRGLFIPLAINGTQYWFHLDTGFSGCIGLLPTTAAAQQIEFDPQSLQTYPGWRGSHAYQTAVLNGLSITSSRSLTWADEGPYNFSQLEVLLYRDIYGELEEYRVGGIVGSGLLSHFNYFMDLRLGRLYLIPRD